ncbi:MAG: hypothetical protein RIC55_17225 [Pirellulaceae bacterium]
MQGQFDPYHKWLGIPPEEQPPHFYRLLAIRIFEDDVDVIEAAADQRMAHLRTLQTGKYADLSQKLLNEVAVARACLLDERRRAMYNQQLKQSPGGQSSSPANVPHEILAREQAVAPPPRHDAPSPLGQPVTALDPIDDLSHLDPLDPVLPPPAPGDYAAGYYGPANPPWTTYPPRRKAWLIPAIIVASILLVFALIIFFIVIAAIVLYADGGAPNPQPRAAARSGDVDSLTKQSPLIDQTADSLDSPRTPGRKSNGTSRGAAASMPRRKTGSLRSCYTILAENSRI